MSGGARAAAPRRAGSPPETGRCYRAAVSDLPPTPVNPPTRVLVKDGRAVARRVGRFRLSVVDGAPADRGKAVEGAVRPLRVGSREGNDLALEDATVSRFHVEIEATPEGYLLRDLGSTNGTQ